MVALKTWTTCLGASGPEILGLLYDITSIFRAEHGFVHKISASQSRNSCFSTATDANSLWEI